MRQHLCSFGTTEAISHEFEEYCEATEEFNREAKDVPGCEAPVVGADEQGNGGAEGKRTHADGTLVIRLPEANCGCVAGVVLLENGPHFLRNRGTSERDPKQRDMREW